MNEVAGSEAVDSSETEAPVNGDGGLHGRRLRRSAEGEVQQFRPATRLALSLGNLLPQFWFNRVRTAFWRAAQMKIGEGSLLMGDVILSGAGDWTALISVGDHTYITGPLRINLGGEVRIGNGVNIGHDCIFLTVDHEIGPPWRRAGFSNYGPIVIGDGVWIASRVTILPGVTVGHGAVVAAGAVVASDVAPHTMVGGVPAKVLRKLSDSWTDLDSRRDEAR
jgi:carbonic anhydrase/acetyltransferase-like protein (isoleucine patch superfamily)